MRNSRKPAPTKEQLANTRLAMIEIQTGNLEDWKLILKPEVYEMLQKSVTSSNTNPETYNNPYLIKRGMDIEMVLHNEIINELKSKQYANNSKSNR